MKAATWMSRFAALGILITAGCALWLILGRPVIESFLELRTSIAQSQETLARYRRLDATRAQLDTSLQRLSDARQADGQLLAGSSTQLIGARLQNHLKELVEANKANLTSMQLLPVREEDGFQRISMAVTFSGTIEALQSILFAIEYQSPYLFVEGLELRANREMLFNSSEPPQSQGLPQSSEVSRELQIQCVVFGYATTGAS